MTLSEIRELLCSDVYVGEERLSETNIKFGCASDLMSDVLAFSRSGAVLLTGLVNVQTIQTAFIVDISAVVFVRGKRPAGDVISLAKEKRIPVLATPYSMYEACGKLYAKGLISTMEPAVSNGFQARIRSMVEPFSQSFVIEGRGFLNAGKASTEIKSILKQLGVNAAVIRHVAIAAYEAEMNVVMYARKAQMTFQVTPNVIRILVSDEGPGIPDIECAMREGYSTATTEMREMGFGAGMGLPNIKKNSDEFTIESEVGKGTRLGITININ